MFKSRDLTLRLVDQGLLALTGLVLVAAAARLDGAAAIGQVAVVTTTALIVGGIARLTLSEPLLYVARDPDSLNLGRAAASTATLLLLAIAIVVLPLAGALPALAVGVAALTAWQEIVRYALISAGRSLAATCVSAALVIAVAGAALWAPSVVVLLTGLAVALLVSGLAGDYALRSTLGGKRWDPRALGGWWRIAGHTAAPGTIDALVSSVSMLLVPLILAARGSVSELGYLRGGQAIIGPLSVVVSGLSVWSLSWLVRRSSVQRAASLLLISALGTAAVVGYTLVLVFAGSSIQQIILGPDLVIPAMLLAMLLATQMLAAWNLGPVGQIKIDGTYRYAIPIRAVAGAAVLILALTTVLGTTTMGVAILLALQALALVGSSTWVAATRR